MEPTELHHVQRCCFRRIRMFKHSPLRLLAVSLLTAVLLGSGYLLAGCGEPEPREAEVEDFRFYRERDGTQVVQGVFVNSGQRYIRGARILIALYDDTAAAPSDSMSIEVRDIEPGAKKVFRQEVDSGVRLSGARVERIISF